MLPTINTTALIQKKYTRRTETGKNITSLQLSVGEKNTKGEYDNFYFDATFWEKGADFVDQYFNEGDIIAIKGDLITTNYAKEDGTKVYKTEVKFPKASFVPKPKTQHQDTPQNNHSQPSQAPQTPTQDQGGALPDIDTSEIPFAPLKVT